MIWQDYGQNTECFSCIAFSVPFFNSWFHNFFHKRNPWGSKRTENYKLQGRNKDGFPEGCACLCNKSWALTTICGQVAEPPFELSHKMPGLSNNCCLSKRVNKHMRMSRKHTPVTQWEPWEWRDGSPSDLFMDWQLTWIWNWNLCNQGCLKTLQAEKVTQRESWTLQFYGT